MDRALREFRIRGVSTNLDFVINLLKHPTFLTNEYSTKFIDTTPELFEFKARQDRATKILTYIADINRERPSRDRRPPAPPRADAREPVPPASLTDTPPEGTRQILEREGPRGGRDAG